MSDDRPEGCVVHSEGKILRVGRGVLGALVQGGWGSGGGVVSLSSSSSSSSSDSIIRVARDFGGDRFRGVVETVESGGRDVEGGDYGCDALSTQLPACEKDMFGSSVSSCGHLCCVVTSLWAVEIHFFI